MLAENSLMLFQTPEFLLFGVVSLILVKFVWSFYLQIGVPDDRVQEEQGQLEQQFLPRVDPHQMSHQPMLPSFQNKASGRSVIFSLGNGHILKQCIREDEILFYQHMKPELLPILPRCCAVFKNQTLTKLAANCGYCSHVSPATLKGLTGSWLILEDLTIGFNSPSILDLKLGTRTHPDSADAAKAARKREKSLKTTSSRLGFRFEGMRLQTTNGLLHVHKKQDPNLTLTFDEPLNMCTLFFLKIRQWDNILDQIRQIKEIIRKLDGYRFYASSLLIIAESEGDKATVRLVDFAKTTIPGVVGKKHIGPDRGCLKGLETLENFIISLSTKM